MREVFQRHLQSLGEEAYQIRQCEISHVRYRRASRGYVLQYALRVTEPGPGTERSQLVTGVMLGDQTLRVWEKLRKLDPEREVANAPLTFAPFSYIPDLQMLVQVFPYDRGLPALPLLVAGPPPELKPLLLAWFGPGEWQIETWEIEPVRYVAELKATLRLTMRVREATTGRVEERHFYAKVYRKEEKGKHTYQVLRALWDKSGAEDEAFTVGRPIAYLSGLRTLFQEEIPGTSLWQMLLRGEEVNSVVRRTARALVTLHLDNIAVSRRHLPRDTIVAAEKRGTTLQRVCPQMGTEIEEIVGAIVSGLEEAPPALTHGDLHLEHIILDGDRLALVDLDNSAGADPILDVARFLAHLAAIPHCFPVSRDRTRAAARAFVDEYFAHVPKVWRTRLPPHYAAAVLRMAENFFRTQEPDWSGKIETLLEEARDCLSGKFENSKT